MGQSVSVVGHNRYERHQGSHSVSGQRDSFARQSGDSNERMVSGWGEYSAVVDGRVQLRL